jgi:flagellin FlaB
MGIGAMIIFIAMVLVAGIAAAVLVQTANRLEIQAMATGEQTKAEISTGVRILDIEGQYGNRSIGGTYYSRIHNMTITISPRAGSSDVDLSTLIIEISNSSRKCILQYGTSTKYAYKSANTGVFLTSSVFNLGAYQFGVIELEDADNSSTASTPVCNRGDKAMLTVNLSACFRGLPVRTNVWGQVIPEEGSAGYFAFTTPAAYTDNVYDLY